MNILIGDIGNTITKICLVGTKNLKVKKIIYFNSNNITSSNSLKKNLKKIIRKKSIYNFSLFSSVVPKYQLMLKKFLKRDFRENILNLKKLRNTIVLGFSVFPALCVPAAVREHMNSVFP
mgnify:CR=1 FL=1